MEWFLVVLLYTVLCKLYLFLGRNSEIQLLKMVSKCAPLVFLSVLVANESLESQGPISTAVSRSTGDLSRLFWGLVFCCIGDAYLVYENLFIFGLVAFSVGQLLYFFLFGGSISMFVGADGREVAAGIAIGLLSIAIFLYLLPKFSTKLAYLAFGYCTLISLMVWSAFVRFHRRPLDVTAVGLFGAATFYTSDVLLSLNRWRGALPFGDSLVMVTYYTAQLFIAGSVLAS